MPAIGTTLVLGSSGSVRFRVLHSTCWATIQHLPSTTSSVADAFRTTLDLFDTGLDLMRQNLQRDHPGATEQEIERRLHQWVQDRPGAEFGDCPGRRLGPKR